MQQSKKLESMVSANWFFEIPYLVKDLSWKLTLSWSLTQSCKSNCSTSIDEIVGHIWWWLITQPNKTRNCNVYLI